MTKVIMKVSEVAAYPQIHASTVYKMVRNGELPAFRVGGDIRFQIEAIDRWRLERAEATPRNKGGRDEVSASVLLLPSSDSMDFRLNHFPWLSALACRSSSLSVSKTSAAICPEPKNPDAPSPLALIVAPRTGARYV